MLSDFASSFDEWETSLYLPHSRLLMSVVYALFLLKWRLTGQFPGRQLVIVSRFWGFTKYTRDEYAKLQQKNVLVPDGAGVKVRSFA
jgi:hypothetical protein